MRNDNDTACDHREEMRLENMYYSRERDSYEYQRQSDRYND